MKILDSKFMKGFIKMADDGFQPVSYTHLVLLQLSARWHLEMQWA